MDMIILSKEEIEKIANSFDCDEKLTSSDFIDFEPDCKIYKLKNNIGDNYILICRDYQFDDTDAEERIFANELGITMIDSNVIKIFSLPLKILTILNIFFHWHELLSGEFLNFFVLIWILVWIFKYIWKF